MRTLLKLKKSQRGQAMVEFVLVLPVLLTLVLGSIDAGWLLYAKIATTAAAREVARDVSVLDKSEYAALKTPTVEQLDNTLLLDEPSEYATLKMTTVPENEIVKITPATYTTSGAKVTITVKTIVSPLVGFLPTSIIPDSVTIQSQVSMRLE